MRRKLHAMSLTLYFHPLSSFCMKALVAFYERGVEFTPKLVPFGDQAAYDELHALCPLAKFPLLHDGATGMVWPESTPLIEFVEDRGSAPPLIPAGRTAALQVRLWDRLCDNYLQHPMQKIVADSTLAEGQHDERGVAASHATINTAYRMLEDRLDGRRWLGGEDFSLADCAALPALFYAFTASPPNRPVPRLQAYFDRLVERPSAKRTLDEAKPYLQFYPFADRVPARFR